MSLRELLDAVENGERFWPLDPVRPARNVRGHGDPYGRDETARCDSETQDCMGTWNGDTSHLHEKVDEVTAVANAYDFGHAHRRDKGLLESLRQSELQAQGGDTSYPGYGDRGQSLSELKHRHETGVEHAWLLFNCRMTFAGVDDHAGVFENAPLVEGNEHLPQDFDDRKHEIGQMLAREGYDVAALNELFRAPFGKPDKAMRKQVDVAEFERGPKKNEHFMDSGLEVDCLQNGIGPTPSIRQHADGEFTYHEGSDNKGWLYVELDMNAGFDAPYVDGGRVDLFVSHTGGNLRDIRTLRDTIRSTSDPQNPTLLVGDMNIDPGQEKFNEMLDILGEVGLQDAWLTRGGIEGVTDIEHTTDPGEELVGCRNYERPGPDGEPVCACDDYPVADPEGTTRRERYHHHDRKRIDYVFLERPRARHAINLDVSRIRRRAFPRKRPCGGGTWSKGPDLDGLDRMRYLSDHMGLEFRTVVSPKRDPPQLDTVGVKVVNPRIRPDQREALDHTRPLVAVDATAIVSNTETRAVPVPFLYSRLDEFVFDPGTLPGLADEPTVTLDRFGGEFPPIQTMSRGTREKAATIAPGSRVRTTLTFHITPVVPTGGGYSAAVTDDQEYSASVTDDQRYSASVTDDRQDSASANDSEDGPEYEASATPDPGENPYAGMTETQLRDQMIDGLRSLRIGTTVTSIRGAKQSDDHPFADNEVAGPSG